MLPSSDQHAPCHSQEWSEQSVHLDPALYQALMPFQREGVARGIELDGCILLADEMGLGKTLQAIGIATCFRHEWPLLVICPTSMSLSWCEELEKWCPWLQPGDINLIKSHHNNEMGAKPVSILTYGLITNGKDKETLLSNVRQAGFKVVVLDEAHYLKSRDAQRTKLLLPAIEGAPRRIALTGENACQAQATQAHVRRSCS